MRSIIVAVISFGYFSTSNAQISEQCGPIVTIYQTVGNLANNTTEIKQFNQFAQTFVTVGTLPGADYNSANNSAYNYETQLIYSFPALNSNVLNVYDPANNFAKVGAITLTSPTKSSFNTLFAKGDYVGYITSNYLVMINIKSLDFSTYSTYTLAKGVGYTEKLLNATPSCADYSLIGNYVYGVTGTGVTPTIYRIDTSTGTATSVSAALSGYSSPAALTNNGWGATWQDINGNFYSFNNGTGEIFRVDNIDSKYAANVNFYRIFKTAASGQNDGFGCELVPDLLDWDGDGVNDLIDLDDDNDGILDTEEGYLGYNPAGDEDLDNTLNYLDTNDSHFAFVDANGDGINDHFDTDMDGIPDSYDSDSDNDGCYDTNEAYGSLVDTNSDGSYGGAITSSGVNSKGLVTAAGIATSGVAYTLSPATNSKVRTAVGISYTGLSASRVNNGANTSFTVAAVAKSTTTFTTAGVPNYTSSTGTSTGFTYQWQVKASDSWSNVTNSSFYSGATSSTLTLTGVNLAYDSYEYRVILTYPDIVCTETSISAVLNVNALLSETSTHGSISESVVGTATGTTDQLSYPLSTSVTLTAVPAIGYVLKSWKVAGSTVTANADNTLTITMSSNTSVEAVFEAAIAEEACAWRSIKAGEWSDNTVWEYLGCTTTQWFASSTAPNNDSPIYVRNNVTISSGTINANSLVISTTGRLEVCGQLNIGNQIIFNVDGNGKAGQLKNNCSGSCTVTMNSSAKAIVRKVFNTSVGAYAWSFMSFPFAVAESRIFAGGTTTPAVWGDLTSSTADFYIAMYDGQQRANNGIVSGVSNYVSLATHNIQANRGYILAGGDKDSIDFVSVAGTQFACTSTVSTSNYTSSTRGECDWGWNMVGAPFVSAYDLYYATGNKPYYVFNSSNQNYRTVMPGDSYSVYPFSSFFVQNLGDASGVAFAGANQTFKAVKAQNSYDEITIQISNSVSSDDTRIRLQEGASASFDHYSDGIKIMSPTLSVPQIYTEAAGACSNIACNLLPLNTSRVDLKVRTAKKDTYTISLTDKNKMSGVSHVILVDAEANKQTDLMTDSYSYMTTIETTTTSSRFYVLLSAGSTTGLKDVDSGILLHRNGRNVFLTGLSGLANVKMYDTLGKLTNQYLGIDNNTSFAVSNSGLYIVEINTDSQKSRLKLIVY